MVTARKFGEMQHIDAELPQLEVGGDRDSAIGAPELTLDVLDDGDDRTQRP